MQAKKTLKLLMEVPERSSDGAEPEAEIEPGESPAIIPAASDAGTTSIRGAGKRRRLLLLGSEGGTSLVTGGSAADIGGDAAASSTFIPVTPMAASAGGAHIVSGTTSNDPGDLSSDLFDQVPMDATVECHPEQKRRKRTLLLVPHDEPLDQATGASSQASERATGATGSSRPDLTAWDEAEREKLFTRFREIFLKVIRLEPALAEQRCAKLRTAGKSGVVMGIIAISAEEAEDMANEAMRAKESQEEQPSPSSPSSPSAVSSSSSTTGEATPATSPLDPWGDVAPSTPPCHAESLAAATALSATERSPHRTLPPLQGVLRPAKPSRRPPRVLDADGIRLMDAAHEEARPLVGHVHFDSDLQPGAVAKMSEAPSIKPEEIQIKSWKELKADGWFQYAGTRAICDECECEVNVVEGRLYGGSDESMFSRDAFSCVCCLRKRGVTEAQLEKLMRRESEQKEHKKRKEIPLPQCDNCKKSVPRQQVNYWDDRKWRRHTYCKECWDQWQKD